MLHPAIARKVLARFSIEGSAAGRLEQNAAKAVHLTDREMEVLQLAASGMTNAQIAGHLYFSVRTVQVHMTHIFDKLAVGSRTEAVITGLRMGLISLEHIHEN